MRAGAYANACFVVGIAKAGIEDGVELIGGSCIISPQGQVLAKAGDHRRRADRVPDRSRPDDAHPQALELPRPSPAPALRHAPPARDGEGVAPMSASGLRAYSSSRRSPMTSPRVDTIVRGGKVVTATDIVETAVAIKGDKIAALGPEDASAPGRPGDRRGRPLRPARPHRLPSPHRRRVRRLEDGAARRRAYRAHHPPALRHLRRGRDPAQSGGPPPRGGGVALRARLRLPLHPEPRAEDPRGPRRGLQDGRHLLQALHDLQEAAQAHGLRRVHRQDHGHPGPAGRHLPAPLRERRHPLLPRGQGHRGGADGAHGFPRRPVPTGRRRRRSTAPSSSASSPTAPSTSSISPRVSASSASSARRRRGSGCGRRPARSTCS